MPVIRRTRPHYARLRRLPGDRRLHITQNGSTTAGHLTSSGLIYRADDPPYLTLQIETGLPIEPGFVEVEEFQIPAWDLFASDIDALAVHAERDLAYKQLLDHCESLRDALNTADPECQHEDVIEVPVLGDPVVPGICVWCPVPLVRVDDEWVPAPCQDGA